MDGFITNLNNQIEDGGLSLVRNAVHFSLTRRGLDTQDLHRAIKIQIVVHASAIINIDDGQFLLDYGEDCGIDYCDGTNEKSGSSKAQELRSQLETFCIQSNIRMLPGVVDAS
jgi:hypothetical protein